MSAQYQPVAARLALAVADHRLEFDAQQCAAAAHLDALGAALRGGRPGAGLWRRLGMRRLTRPRSGPAPRGLYLWGSVGRGKTRLLDLFYESMDFTDKERNHFYAFMRDVHAQLRAAAHRVRPLQIVAQRMAERARLICLDEFFVADIADAMILSGLLDGLFRRGVTLVATSNSPPQDLYKDGLQRQRFLPAIASMRRRMQVVHLDGAVDYRLRNFDRARTYFDSNRPETPAEMQRLFCKLSAGSAAGPSAIEVLGRSIAAADSAPGLVCFEFRELCASPRGADDYIELARRYRTIFVAGVPVFGGGDEDAARRFLMLIDTLYDCGVKIVVSAAAPAQALYRGERLAGEFERAASRLVEMQSQRYLAGEHRP
ncbi:MAG TPA: cell division protein ZapE [Steroidobacteraceae bacterium]|nr:cell division protein ZapE [Steroidobacteraceae bacterium]